MKVGTVLSTRTATGDGRRSLGCDDNNNSSDGDGTEDGEDKQLMIIDADGATSKSGRMKRSRLLCPTIQSYTPREQRRPSAHLVPSHALSRWTE